MEFIVLLVAILACFWVTGLHIAEVDDRLTKLIKEQQEKKGGDVK